MAFVPVDEAERHIMARRNKETGSRPRERHRTEAGNRSSASIPGAETALAGRTLERRARCAAIAAAAWLAGQRA
jgi:hypothetical protein